MDNSWKAVQTKTFTKWINAKLSTSISDIYVSLQDGIILGNLLERLTGERLPVPLNIPATTRFQRVENVQYVLDFISSRGITLVNIGSVDIVDGNEKLILGLVWIIILRFSIFRTPSDEAVDNSLLSWCRAAVAGYNIPVRDFSRSWQDGKAFNAVIARFLPNAVDPSFITCDDALHNLEQAFAAAEEHLDIPRLLDPEDIAGVLRPDEKSVMTYLSLFYDKLRHRHAEGDDSRISELRRALDIRKQALLATHDSQTNLDSIRSCMQANKERFDALMREASELCHANTRLEHTLISSKLETAATIGTIRTIEDCLGIEPTDLSKFHASALKREVDSIRFCKECFAPLPTEEVDIQSRKKLENLKNLRISEGFTFEEASGVDVLPYSTVTIPRTLDLSQDILDREISVLADHSDLNTQFEMLEKEINASEDLEFKNLAAQKLKILKLVLGRESGKEIVKDALTMFEAINSIENKIKLSEAEIIFSFLNLTSLNKPFDILIEKNEKTNSITEFITKESFINEINQRYKNSFNVNHILEEIKAIRNFDVASSSSTTDESALRNVREKHLLKMEDLIRQYDLS